MSVIKSDSISVIKSDSISVIKSDSISVIKSDSISPCRAIKGEDTFVVHVQFDLGVSIEPVTDTVGPDTARPVERLGKMGEDW